jgi:plastocyanin
LKIKKVIAIVAFVLMSLVLTVAFYDLYLYNIYVTNRYLSNPTGSQQIKVVVVIIPSGAGSDPRIGFEPAVISIVIGVNNTVVWRNEDSTWHTAHSNVPEFYSNYIEPGGNFTHTFQRPGVYPYHCDPHPWMTGRITVYSPVTNGPAQVLQPSTPQPQIPEVTFIGRTPQNKWSAASPIEF